jgi:glyoxylate carboligase
MDISSRIFNSRFCQKLFKLARVTHDGKTIVQHPFSVDAAGVFYVSDFSTPIEHYRVLVSLNNIEYEVLDVSIQPRPSLVEVVLPNYAPKLLN